MAPTLRPDSLPDVESARQFIETARGILRDLGEIATIGPVDTARVEELRWRSDVVASIERDDPHKVFQEQHIRDEFQAMLPKDSPKLGDGALRTVEPDMDRLQPAGKPEFGDNTRVFFVNGIKTTDFAAMAEAKMLAGRMHQNVDLVYVQTNGVEEDLKRAIKETFDPANGRNNPPEKTLATNIEQTLDRGENVHIVGYSRGALVTQLALQSVRDHYEKQGHDEVWVERHIGSHITVETLNGASHTMLPGVNAEHYVSKYDDLVANTIGMGASAPSVRAVAAVVIDGTLRAANALPESDRAALAGEINAVRDDLRALETDLRADVPRTSPAVDPGRGLHDLTKLAKDLDTLLGHKPMTPGADEVRRDGAGNTPNGPVRTVPAYYDLPHLKSGDYSDFVTEQHDLPGMLPSRIPHTATASVIAGDLSPQAKELVDRAIPEFNEKGARLPAATSISAWKGTAEQGTVFKVDDHQYGISVGQGKYLEIDASRFPNGTRPPENAYLRLQTDGAFTVVSSPEQHLNRQQTQHHGR